MGERIGVSRDLLIASLLFADLVVGLFDQEAFLEPGAGANEGEILVNGDESGDATA